VHGYDPSRTLLLGHCSYLGPVPLSVVTRVAFRKKYDRAHRSSVVDAELPSSLLTLVRLSPVLDALQVVLYCPREVARFGSPHCGAVAVVEVRGSREVAERLYSHHVAVALGDRRRELGMPSRALGVRYEELR